MATENESLERAINEEVALAAYNPEWPAMFLSERNRLMALFPSQLLDVQHFGSTAIPGMPAKPVVDLLGGVQSMAIADSLTVPLLNAGYATSAEFNATLTDRRWYMRWRDGRRTHHLHLVVFRGPDWNRRLCFRDTLRSNADLAFQYAALKEELVARHHKDREAYTHAKTEFVQSVLGSTQ